MAKGRSKGKRPADEAGVAARRTALDALVRIAEKGAYANLVTNHVLDRSGLADRDRRFVTELVYGTTRWQRACDHLVDRHRRGDVTPRVRAALRMGAYQLGWLEVPPHAAVGVTVSASPKPARGLVNAILRRVATDVADGLENVDWPDEATRLSYPDWIVASVHAALGDDATAALRVMNDAATMHVRDDGYVQDPASMVVVDAVAAHPGEWVLDVCAAPGGKATAIAAAGAHVLASDLHPARAGLVVDNRDRLADAAAPDDAERGAVVVAVADAGSLPVADRRVDVALVDAPCTGLGVLRRRPDARWRIDVGAVERLAALQCDLVVEAARTIRPGGRLVYSVCTLTREETVDVADRLDGLLPGFRPVDRELLAPTEARDGMFLARWIRTG